MIQSEHSIWKFTESLWESPGAVKEREKENIRAAEMPQIKLKGMLRVGKIEKTVSGK